ncbi:MAG TPA: hypothetical protein PKI20_13535 [Verrucomicrobiota bacterium]|nr:hypothetical protein [Verrucomicrobiota bacterium]
MAAPEVLASLQMAVRAAVGFATRAIQDCLLAGQALNEARVLFQRNRGPGGAFESWDYAGGFEEFVCTNLPEISLVTAQRWMRASRNVLMAVVGEELPEADPLLDRFGLAPSVVLRKPDAELDAEALLFKRNWFYFTENRTLKSCLGGILVGADRSVNGSVLGGGGGDRRDYADFTLRKLQNISTFFSSWDRMPERQRTEIKDEFAAAICGEEFKLRGRRGEEIQVPVRFEPWPEDVCRVAMEALRERMRRARGWGGDRRGETGNRKPET